MIARDLAGAVSNSVGKLKSAANFNRAEDAPIMAANEEPARPDPSVLSANTEMVGKITTTDELHIQGKLDGNVRATSIIVCQGGVVNGDILADSVTIHGTVKGNIDGGEVILCAGAVVDGEISHRSLGIDRGANFEGSIKRKA